MNRFDRNVRFFGAEGQRLLSAAHVGVVGCGGLGQHVIQQLAFLGVGKLTLIDDEEVAESNLNRYVLARTEDVLLRAHKVDVAEKSIRSVDSQIEVVTVKNSLRSHAAFAALRSATTIFGCLDNDGARLVLNEYAKAYRKHYFDLASDILPEERLRYGGRIVYVDDRPGCLVCMDEIDLVAARMDLESDAARQD